MQRINDFLMARLWLYKNMAWSLQITYLFTHNITLRINVQREWEDAARNFQFRTICIFLVNVKAIHIFSYN